MRLNYMEQLAKMYEYPYLQKDTAGQFPYQQRLPGRKDEGAGFFHVNCKVTKKRVCCCGAGPAGRTDEDDPKGQYAGLRKIAKDLTMYFDGYTPDMIRDMEETKRLEQERMRNMKFAIKPEICFGDYMTEQELDLLQKDVDLSKMKCEICQKIIQESQHRKLVKTEKGTTILVCKSCASEYDYTDVNEIQQKF